MKHLHYIFLSVFLFSCELDEVVSVPDDYVDSSYDYTSTSIYFDDRGEISQQGTNWGSFDMVSSENVATLVIYPRTGWSYELTIDNLTDHVLSDGSTVTSFRIHRSTQYVKNATSNDYNEFRVDGTTNIPLDADNSTLGKYDGLILDNGEYNFEFESINVQTGEYVITTINGVPLDQ